MILQTIYFFVDFSSPEKSFQEKDQWMSLQSEIDAMKLAKLSDKPKVYSFNPNFITDYKGYKLGMSVQENRSSVGFSQREQICKFSKRVSGSNKSFRFFIKYNRTTI
ncbi:hypothetical protein [Flavobacterium bizetiae]|nr:hypothetical protein [Flavobacterium bizetiae]